jgi:hypothetical protein
MAAEAVMVEVMAEAVMVEAAAGVPAALRFR